MPKVETDSESTCGMNIVERCTEVGLSFGVVIKLLSTNFRSSPSLRILSSSLSSLDSGLPV